jgi:hypothetical protein
MRTEAEEPGREREGRQGCLLGSDGIELQGSRGEAARVPEPGWLEELGCSLAGKALQLQTQMHKESSF